MNTINHLAHQFSPYLHDFTHALACLGLGLEGAVTYDDDAFLQENDARNDSADVSETASVSASWQILGQ